MHLPISLACQQLATLLFDHQARNWRDSVERLPPQVRPENARMTMSRYAPTMALPATPHPAAAPAVERYAETLATLHHLRSDQRSAHLAGLGLTAEAWDNADRAWTELLTRPGHPGDDALALAFASAFARARRRLRLVAASTAPSPPPAEPGDETMAIACVAVHAVLPFVDGFVDPASFEPCPPRDEASGHETAAIPILRPRPALPFTSGGACVASQAVHRRG